MTHLNVVGPTPAASLRTLRWVQTLMSFWSSTHITFVYKNNWRVNGIEMIISVKRSKVSKDKYQMTIAKWKINGIKMIVIMNCVKQQTNKHEVYLECQCKSSRGRVIRSYYKLNKLSLYTCFDIGICCRDNNVLPLCNICHFLFSTL